MSHSPILVPVDFDEGSIRALSLASELAAALGAEVTIVHVYELPIYTYPGLDPAALPPLHTEVTDAARRALDEFAKQHGVDRAVLREGDVEAEILGTAKELQARMIVMGTHGRGGLAHALLGSVTERVVRRSPIPVVTVRADK
jgi:nucleotide-binding universal stress UspA family protein